MLGTLTYKNRAIGQGEPTNIATGAKCARCKEGGPWQIHTSKYPEAYVKGSVLCKQSLMIHLILN